MLAAAAARVVRERGKKSSSGRDGWMIAGDATKLEKVDSPTVPIKSRVVELVVDVLSHISLL